MIASATRPRRVSRRLAFLMGTLPFWLLVISCATSLTAQDDDALALRRKLRTQQQVSAMCAELVASVLDVQLRQLQENQLDQRAIHADIASMRSHLEQLVAGDMHELMRLLEAGQQSSESERQQTLLDARAKIREIVSTLMAERQRIDRRLQLARIAAQTRQLIDLQNRITRGTGHIAEEEPRQRERLSIAMIEDQRDAGLLYARLIETLGDVAKWEGKIGAVAAQGRQMLQSSTIERELQRSEQLLSASRHSDAQEAQRSVIQSLKAMLEMVERSQGIEGSDRAAVSRMVTELLQKQDQLRAETNQANLRDAQQGESLAERQRKIHQDLKSIAELPQTPNAPSLMEQAQSASHEAEIKLFEGDQVEAVRQQGMVIRALDALSEQLQVADAKSEKSGQSLDQQARPSDASQEVNDQPLASNEKMPRSQSEESNTSNSRQSKPRDASEQTPSKAASAKGKENGAMESDPQRSDQADSTAPPDAAQPTDQRDSRSSAGNSPGDIAARRFADVAWFAKLPPAMQQAIQARARRAAPRGYEERLKRYFQSEAAR